MSFKQIFSSFVAQPFFWSFLQTTRWVPRSVAAFGRGFKTKLILLELYLLQAKKKYQDFFI